jgi:uncharacterized membrane protein
VNKNEFLITLERSLSNFTNDERREILYDYEEHFRIGEEIGKSEEQLIGELGDPDQIARQYRANQRIDLAEAEPSTKNIFRAVFAAISLGFFNLIFVFGPFMGIVGALIGFFAAAIGITVAGGGMMLGVLLAPVIPEFINLPGGAAAGMFIFYGAGTMALGALFFIGVCYITKYFYIGTVKYLKWNLSIIKK